MDTSRRGFFQLCAYYASLTAIPSVLPSVEELRRCGTIAKAISTPPLELPEEIEMRIGLKLIPLLHSPDGKDVGEGMARTRRVIFCDYGLIVPPVRIRDQRTIDDNGYLFLIRGNIVAAGSVHTDKQLVLNYDEKAGGLPGVVPTPHECPSLRPCIWTDGGSAAFAKNRGYTVVDAVTVIVHHFYDVILRNAADLLTRQATVNLLETVRSTNPSLAESATERIGIGRIQRILQTLLRERQSIRDIVAILEALTGDLCGSADFEQQVNVVRSALDNRNLPLLHVVITDTDIQPDYFVGLSYYPQLYPAPLVALSGQGERAREYFEQVRSKHFVHPDAKLAETLYRNCRRCDEISPKFYDPVAAALASSYRQTERSPWLWTFHTDVV